MEGTIGEIRMFAGNFAPRNWAFCYGQLMSISSNTALFAILGTTFGGNGTSTFALPDFRGRVAVGTGTGGTGISNVILGQVAGTETHTLTISEMPAHTHSATVTAGTGSSSATATLNAVNTPGNLQVPTGNYLGASRTASVADFVASGTTVAMNSGSVTISNVVVPTPSVTVATTGSSTPFSVLQPYLGMNHIICLYGVFPSRN